MKEFTVGINDAGQRLDKFISKTLTTLPPALMYKAIRTKKIKVNRKRAEPGTVLHEGDSVLCFLSPEFFAPLADPEDAYLSIKPSLYIVYEDENILLADKKPGMLSHSDEGGDRNTLIDHIKAYLYQKGEYRPDEENSFAPALCNRIDRNTGGIVIAAKTAEALREMNERIKARDVQKYYLCAVRGVPEKRADTLTGYLIKDQKTNTVSVYDKPGAGRVKIVTEYRVLKTKDGASLLEVHLITGKTHQIRSHLSHIGHPLLGDGKYGVNREDKKRGYAYQALYSYKVVFDFRDGPLSYLNGKEFKVDADRIWFIEDFS